MTVPMRLCKNDPQNKDTIQTPDLLKRTLVSNIKLDPPTVLIQFNA